MTEGLAHSILLCTLVLGGFSLGCTADAPSPSAATAWDSAGIEIREHPARSQGLTRLRGIETVSIGALEGDETEIFNRIGDIQADPEGRLHVLDAGDQVVDVYDSDGTWVLRYGGEGEGPSEFLGSSLLIPRADSMGVYDYRNRKIAFFGADGSLLATRRWELPIFEFGFPSELAPIPGGLAAVFQDGCRMPAPEERRPTWKLLTLAHDGSVKDTIALGFRSNSVALYGDRFCSVIPALAGTGYELVARDDGLAAYTAERDYEILLFRLSARGDTAYDGTLPTPERIVRRALDPALVTSAEIEEYHERYLTVSEDDPIGPDRVEAVRQALDTTKIPERHPRIASLLWDDQGRLWVGRTVLDDDPLRTWDVYDEAGRLVAEAVLPAALGNVLVVGDMAWGSVQDELGVMYVKGFRLEEASATSGGP